MADIGGFPVHNYGSDPLGKLGMEMFKSSLDWDEKKKELERKAVNEAATQRQGAFMKTVEGGTATPGVGAELYGQDIGSGVDRLSQQNKVTEDIKRLTSVIKMNTDQQTYNDKEIENLTKAQEKLITRKLAIMESTNPTDRDEMLVYMNDQIQAMDAKISKIRGFDVGNSVLDSDITSWKKTKQEEAIKQIATIGKELDAATSSKTPDPEAIGAASAKLRVAITTARKTWNLPVETFTLEAKLLDDAQGAIKQNVINQLKPKEPQKPPVPTNEDKAISDRLATLGLEDSPQNRDKVRGILANDPSKARDTALISNTAFISKVLKIPEQEAIQLALKTKDSEGTVTDINKLGTMLESLSSDKNPPKWKIALIEKTAEKLGWNLVKVDKKTEPGEVFGKVWPTTTEEGGYSLEPKKDKAKTVAPQGAAPITATNPKTGQKIRWDGTKWVPVK